MVPHLPRLLRQKWASPCDTPEIQHSPAGQESVWHHFKDQEDGGHPLAGVLIRDSAGNLYGTTSSGGAANLGTVLQLQPNGILNTLYSFLGGNHGTKPESGVIRDSSGNLYGTTSNGGGPANSGVVYKVAPDRTETVLYSFTGGLDGAFPMGGVIRDAAGNLYGTTVAGGSAGFGTVFKLTPSGVETVLYNFTDGSDGASPWGGLIRDKSGNFYGTARDGGGIAGCGTVFELAQSDLITGRRIEFCLAGYRSANSTLFPQGRCKPIIPLDHQGRGYPCPRSIFAKMPHLHRAPSRNIKWNSSTKNLWETCSRPSSS